MDSGIETLSRSLPYSLIAEAVFKAQNNFYGFVMLKQKEMQLWKSCVSNELLFLKAVKFSKWVLYS